MGSGESGGRGGQGDECLSPDKGVCILLLGERQRGRVGGRERIQEVLTDDKNNFWKIV